MARRLLVPLAAVALGLGAAGCGPDEPEPRKTDLIDLSGDDPSDGGGAEPSDGGGGEPSDGGGDEPVNAAPDIPAPDPADYPGMDENTHKGAIEFSEYYVAVVYWSLAVGDSSIVSSYSTDECQSCSQVEEDVTAAVESDELLAPVEISPVESQSFPSETYDIEVSYMYDIRTLGAGGAEAAPELYPYRALVGVVWIEGSWRVAGLAIEEDGEASDPEE